MRHFITSRLRSSRSFALSSTLAAGALLSAYGFGLTEPPSASATTARRATVQSLTEQAELIVYARIGGRWTPKTRGPQGQIYTYTELTPLEVWRGEARAPLMLVQLGGQIGDLRLKVEGDAELKSGQEVVLFLTRSPGDAPPVTDERAVAAQAHAVNLVSLAQGVFYLERSPESRSSEASPDVSPDSLTVAPPQTPLRQNLDGIVFYQPVHPTVKLSSAKAQRGAAQPSTSVTEVAPEVERAWTLASLKARVKQLSAGGSLEGGAR